MKENDWRRQLEETQALVQLVGIAHECGVSLPTRTVFLCSEAGGDEESVDTKMAEKFLKNIHMLEYLSNDPITIMMDCTGGDFYHGLAIYDAILCSPCTVKIIVRGCAMSMGSAILQAADERVMGPNAIMMIHYGESYIHGTHSKTAQKWSQESLRADNWIEDLYLARMQEKDPKLQMEGLRVLLQHDTFLTAQKCVDLGLADKVG